MGKKRPGRNKDKCKRYEQENRREKNKRRKVAKQNKRLAYFKKRRELKEGLINDAETQ